MISNCVSRPVEILLIEDNLGDVFLTREAFQEANVDNNIHEVKDGEEALEYLGKEGRYSEAPTPDLILLDLNLPKVNGVEVLAKMKKSPSLRRIPVVILTSSRADQDVIRTYDLGANSYLVKPSSIDGFQQMVAALESFWFSLAVLPVH